MKPVLLNKDLQTRLLTSAIDVQVRMRKPAAFTVAMDAHTTADSYGSRAALAHVVVLSVEDANAIEETLKARGVLFFEVTQGDFE